MIPQKVTKAKVNILEIIIIMTKIIIITTKINDEIMQNKIVQVSKI
jgi:hypothetical protein